MAPRGCLWTIAKPLLLLVMVGAVLFVAAFPWAIPMPERHTLNGLWIGGLRSNSGPQTWLLLSLGPSRTYRPRVFGFLTGRGTPLGGYAAVCTARRRIDLSVSGDTIAWSGKKIDVLLRPVLPSPPELRIEIVGVWDGHVLEFTQRNVSLADMLSESGSAGSESESSKFVSASLHRGTRAEFDSACRQLTSH